jgi:hypothetical protein
MLRECMSWYTRNVVTASGSVLDLVPAHRCASEVTDYACLAWFPLLAPTKVPTYRTVIIALEGYSIMCPSQCIIPTRTTASVNSAPGLDLPLHVPAFVHTVPSKMVYPDDSNSEKENS